MALLAVLLLLLVRLSFLSETGALMLGEVFGRLSGLSSNTKG